MVKNRNAFFFMCSLGCFALDVPGVKILEMKIKSRTAPQTLKYRLFSFVGLHLVTQLIIIIIIIIITIIIFSSE